MMLSRDDLLAECAECEEDAIEAIVRTMNLYEDVRGLEMAEGLFNEVVLPWLELDYGGTYSLADLALEKNHENPPRGAIETLNSAIVVSVLLAVDQCREARASNVSAAWRAAKKSQFWFGVATAMSFDVLHGKDPDQRAREIISRRAKAASDAAHSENRQNMRAAFDWLDLNHDANRLTVDAAAKEIEKLVPVRFSTAQTYVRIWRKIAKNPNVKIVAMGTE